MKKIIARVKKRPSFTCILPHYVDWWRRDITYSKPYFFSYHHQ